MEIDLRHISEDDFIEIELPNGNSLTLELDKYSVGPQIRYWDSSQQDWLASWV